MPKTSIQIDEKTRDLILEQGNMLDSYDTVLVRLLEELKSLRNGSKPKKE